MAKMSSKHHTDALLVIRLRGGINTIPKIKETLQLLRLNKINHCIVIPKNNNMLGMLQVVKDYVTWGEVDEKTLGAVIEKRGRLMGDRPITDSYVKEVTDYKSVQELASAVVSGKFRYGDLKDVKPLFRLHPPIGGVGKTKRHFTVGGVLGYRGGAINEFVSRMIMTPKQKKKEPGPTKAAPPARKVKKAPKVKKAEKKVVKKVKKSKKE